MLFVMGVACNDHVCRCRHCANLKPIYEEVATQLGPRGIKLARVNTETATEVQEKYAINQFPYVVIFRNCIHTRDPGRRLEYQVYPNVTVSLVFPNRFFPFSLWSTKKNGKKRSGNVYGKVMQGKGFMNF